MHDREIALQRIQSLLNTKGLASLGPDARSSRETVPTLERILGEIFTATKIQGSTQPLIRSLALLWHDHLDASHSISQDIHNTDGSFLHGIMHRREPDYGNAKYWFHKVGVHSCFPTVARSATELLGSQSANDLKAKLVRAESWDPFAFIDACEMALEAGDMKIILLLEEIQAIEFNALLEHFLRDASG